MTAGEFKSSFRQLCDGHRFEPTPQQIDAFYERLKHHDVRDLNRAVVVLLTATRFPLFDQIHQAILNAQEQRRGEEYRREKHEAERWDAGKVKAQGLTDEECNYNQFRMDLLKLARQQPPNGFREYHAEGLQGWLTGSKNYIWASGEPIKGKCHPSCPSYERAHTLLQCLQAEIDWWRKDG